MATFKLLIETFRGADRSVQFVLGLCLLATIGGLLTLFILVAINPLALGGVAGLITALTSTLTFLLRKGTPPPPTQGH